MKKETEKYAYGAYTVNSEKGITEIQLLNPSEKEGIDSTYYYPTFFNGIVTLNKVCDGKVTIELVSNNFVILYN